MSKIESKTEPFSMRFRPALKRALTEAAARERRSLTNLIEIHLEDWMFPKRKSAKSAAAK